MRDTRSLLLLLLSICIAGTWVYHIYDKNEYAKHPNIVYVQQGPQPLTDDSYANVSMKSTDTSMLTGTIEEKLEAIRALKKEIEGMLADTTINQPRLRAAAEKIRHLHEEMNTLGNEADSLLNQKQANGDYKTEADPKGSREPATSATPAVKKEMDTAPDGLRTNTAEENTFIASKIDLKGMDQAQNEQWDLTNEAKSTNGLSVNFSVSNDRTSFKSTPIYVVLTDPKGNIVQDDLWEGGIVSTKNSGIIRYTRKVNVEYEQGLQKKVSLLIQLPEFSSGKYKVQLYHNNQLIGKTALTLH